MLWQAAKKLLLASGSDDEAALYELYECTSVDEAAWNSKLIGFVEQHRAPVSLLSSAFGKAQELLAGESASATDDKKWATVARDVDSHQVLKLIRSASADSSLRRKGLVFLSALQQASARLNREKLSAISNALTQTLREEEKARIRKLAGVEKQSNAASIEEDFRLKVEEALAPAGLA
jgi:hypothetical protein